MEFQMTRHVVCGHCVVGIRLLRCFNVLLCWYACLSGFLATSTHSLQRQIVQLDLRYGMVRGYSDYISFVSAPTPSDTRRCNSQAVIRIDFSGPYKVAKILLDYADRPRLWTLDVSDSSTGDGYGGDNGTTSNMAETQIFNRQMRIYGNSLPGYMDNTIDGGLLLRVEDNIVKKGSQLTLEVSDEKIKWIHAGRKQDIESKFLYTLQGQNTTYGEVDYTVYAGFNRVVAGSFRSGSGLCRVVVTLTRGAVDECKTGRSDCHKDAHCYNTRRSYRCKCKRGFYGNGKICHDENECEFENGGCVHYCANTRGNYTCSCKPGFQVARDGHNCIDKNECFYNKGGCQHQCINTLGKYECKCNAGYSLHANGKRCIPGTWCQDELGCAHHCQSSANGMVCACRRGYRLHQNGKDCIATCVVGNGGCQHECTNTASGPVCTCHKKYMLRADGKTCTATCGVNNGGCDRRCEDTPKGPRCSCPPGYVLHQDGKTCLDVDECRHKNGGCSHACVNAHGSYECICPKGFKVQHDQKTCSDVNECSLNTTCDHICVNSPGSYKCGCRRGFQKYGKSHCADQNECSKNNGGCEHRCRNVIGGYECLCNEGFKLHHNKKDCVVAAKCLPLKAPAKSVLQCHTRGREERCTLQCQKNSHFAAGSEEKYVVTCGNSTDYMWTHERNNTSLPSCSETIAAPGFRRRACFLMPTAQCKLKKKMKDDFRNNLSQTVVGQNKYKCTEMCEVNYVRLQCGTRRRKFRRKAKKDKVALIRAEFELQVKPQNPTERCNMQCVHDRTQRRLKRTIKRLKKSINRGQFSVKLDGQHYHVTKNSFKASRQQLMCNLGQVLVKDKCVSCSIGSYFDISLQKCDFCPPGTYQNKEGQLSCIPCPNAAVHEGGVQGARNVSECGGQCNPGNYSDDGFEPCTPCRKGTYQPDYGRTTCVSCGPGIITRKSGARGFQDCIVKDKCRPGHYYNMKKQRCEQCSRATYQPAYGQNFCIDCPGNTTTDSPGSVNSTDCKDRRCGGVLGKTQGFIQSPNWPGPYPSNVECTWTIVPEKGRRILVVIPEIFLAAGNKCGDILVMRKSSSPYSLTTYETCESTETPIAFTARSKKLWIRFKTDNKGLSAAGFSIPYVTYNEEYQDLIEDIVRDGRLYSSHQHQEVLKDRKLLSALLDVIAIPYNYFKYYNQSETMFPESFIRLLTPKVRRFFSN